MAKKVDKKKQDRVTLDTLLASITQDGVIYAGSLKRKWISLKGLINPKRLVHFLEKTGTKIARSATAYLYTVRKDLSTTFKHHPDLIATWFVTSSIL